MFKLKLNFVFRVFRKHPALIVSFECIVSY